VTNDLYKYLLQFILGKYICISN